MDSLKLQIKRLINRTGWSITRNHNDLEYTLLGLRKRPIRTIFDIGANTGQSAKNYRKLFPEATIYCFEPMPETFDTLYNWSLTQGGYVKTYNLALGDEVGQVVMNQHIDHSPSSSLLSSTSLAVELYPQVSKQKQQLVKLEKLDNLEHEFELKDEILIKIDVQGYEFKVIQGGQKIFRCASACILEVSSKMLYDGQASFISLISILDKLGFSYIGNLNQSYHEDGSVIFFDAVFFHKKYFE